MTDGKRIFAENRLAIIVIGVLIIVAILMQALFVYPLTGQVERTRLRRSEAARGLANAELALHTARALADDQRQADADLRRFYGEILPRNLAGARGITWPNLASLADRHNLLLQRRGSLPERDHDSPLARLSITMLLAGEWSDIRRFIYELENAPEFIVIEDIILSQNEDVDSSLVLTLALTTYYQAEEKS